MYHSIYLDKIINTQQKKGLYFTTKGVRKASVLSGRIMLTYVLLRFSPRRKPSLPVKYNPFFASDFFRLGISKTIQTT